MKRLIAIFMLLAGVGVAGDNGAVIPVSVHAQAERAVFKAGKPLSIRLALTNGLSKTIRFSTFATQPTEWNGETFNVSLVDVYRGGKKRNLCLDRPEVKPPLSISGPAAYLVKPGGTIGIMIDISKWQIQGGWTEGAYELVFRMGKITVDDKVILSVLSGPIHVVIE